MPKRERGFTLIELLIAIFIILILLSSALPSLRIFFKRGEERVMREQLLQAIALTRQEAINRRLSVFLCGSLDLIHCNMNWNRGFIVYRPDKIFHAGQLSYHTGVLHWRAFPTSELPLEFLPAGFPHAQNGTFWYCRKDTATPTFALVINQMGRIRTVEENSKDFPAGLTC